MLRLIGSVATAPERSVDTMRGGAETAVADDSQSLGRQACVGRAIQLRRTNGTILSGLGSLVRAFIPLIDR
jgi:hypothetical protein